ncbi:MAG: NADH-quinone oxidoreductase subunit NuoH [Deltaproteobacteria bacterium]|nr:NADH-quinone oxidoreductase subunit NuoH [Deltaproteobacteria bacterium]
MEVLSRYIADSLELGPLAREILYAILIVAAAAIVFLIALIIAGLLTYLERRVAGRVQSRVGPNRVGPFGLLQWLADGLKLVMKEDLTPADADRVLFRLAPYVMMVGVFAAFASVPFGLLLIAADLNVGVLYILAITSLATVGVLMAGWASNNKWSMFGGIRAAAQIVSYEVPAALAILSVVLLSGTLSMQGIIAMQGGWPWEWFIFHNPLTFVAFFIYFIAAVAEGNRIPFDLPEAESELIAGYNTEYSGMRFAAFFLGEFANVYLMCAIATTLFLGGWQIPGIGVETQADSVLLQIVGLAIFMAKASVGCFVVIWLRWTLPRLRVDQLMGLCYRYLVPIAFFCLAGNAVYLLVVPDGSYLGDIIHYLTAALGGLVVLIFFWRVFYHIRSVGDKKDFNFFARGERYRFDPSIQVRRYGRFRKQRGKETG